MLKVIMLNVAAPCENLSKWPEKASVFYSLPKNNTYKKNALAYSKPGRCLRVEVIRSWRNVIKPFSFVIHG